jgi:hypothetical protein
VAVARIAAGPNGSGAGVAWWNRKPGERAQWVLDPLTAVGPLRFGMSPGQVATALGGAVAGVSLGRRDNESWQQFSDIGVTAIYAPGPRLVAVAVDAMDGPLVRFRHVELIARRPSEVRTDLHDLARREGATVRVSWSGDPEVARWGLPWAPRWNGGCRRRGPWSAGTRWSHEPNPGAWPVRPDRDRPRWSWTPLEPVCGGGLGPEGLTMFVRAARAGDTVVSEARFGAQDWDDHG